jgi:hypothetical protein
MIRNDKQTERDTCMDRIPFASLIAAAMTFTGTIVFCCFTYASIDGVLKMVTDRLRTFHDFCIPFVDARSAQH